jgi:hypothetical protein
LLTRLTEPITEGELSTRHKLRGLINQAITVVIDLITQLWCLLAQALTLAIKPLAPCAHAARLKRATFGVVEVRST